MIAGPEPRIGYAGREFDSDTGFYNYRARWYSPEMGRFISGDPLGHAAGDTNFYRYVGNSPANFTDPTGMFALDAALGSSQTTYSLPHNLLSSSPLMDMLQREEEMSAHFVTERYGLDPFATESLDPVLAQELREASIRYYFDMHHQFVQKQRFWGNVHMGLSVLGFVPIAVKFSIRLGGFCNRLLGR
ncbi:MAG: RHS repeat-associated core domain-containing protein [Planctomycetales bacterium]|nr:RHS repeat-associated core domain-containing protein [Planctomycetales bacterium]